MNAYLMPTAGGLLIGLSALVMMAGLGRITGISGTLFEALKNPGANLWRLAFLLGLIAGTALVHYVGGLPIPEPRNGGFLLAIVGGLLVGFGTRLGSGCTSGHGVCGIGRLSMRSIVATMVFMASGIATVSIIRHLIPAGGLL